MVAAGFAVAGVTVALLTGPATASTLTGSPVVCLSPVSYNSVVALKTASHKDRDVVTNQYRLPTPAVTGVGIFGPTTAIVVKVYWHVIRSAADNDPLHGDIPSQWITDEIAHLNTAYSGGEDPGNAANLHITFQLAGTDRTTNAAWYNGIEPDEDSGGTAEFDMKSALRKGDYGDLNVYSASLGEDLLGWATFPESKPDATTRALDGVVVLDQSLPGGNADFGPDEVYNEGDTLTHEAGHWFGLYHTFEDWGTGNGCKGKGDYVNDTPSEFGPNFACDESADTCPSKGTDPVHNYMDYTDDVCMVQFTAGQAARVSGIWKKDRMQKPAITDLDPTDVSTGAPFTVDGYFLTNATQVLVGKVSASFTVVSDSELTVTVPAGVSKKQKVTVVTPYGKASSKAKLDISTF